jgi:hypothetical protein
MVVPSSSWDWFKINSKIYIPQDFRSRSYAHPEIHHVFISNACLDFIQQVWSTSFFSSAFQSSSILAALDEIVLHEPFTQFANTH